MALRYVYNPRQSTYRLAVIVSRKIHKSAVQRNRVRRRLYAIVQSLEPQLTEACDLVLTVYSDQVVNLPPDELTDLVTRLFAKAGVLHPPAVPPTPATRAIVDESRKES